MHIKQFLDKNNYEYYENYDISQVSAVKIGSRCKLVIFPKNQKELEKILVYFYSNKIFYRVFGNTSNILFISEISYPIVILNRMNDEYEVKGNLISVSAGMLISKFCEILKKNRLSGYEGLVNIPATIGGAIFNNAGAFGYSISDHLVKIIVFADGKIREISQNEIKFGYHYSNLSGFIILSAVFWFEKNNEYDIINLSNKFTYLRNKTQPSGLTLGSVFRKINSKSAGFYIERSGLKGLRIGGISVSSKHSNFFVNDKMGSALDFLALMSLVQKSTEKQFGLCLVPEIEKVGDRDEINCRLSHTFKE